MGEIANPAKMPSCFELRVQYSVNPSSRLHRDGLIENRSGGQAAPLWHTENGLKSEPADKALNLQTENSQRFSLHWIEKFYKPLI